MKRPRIKWVSNYTITIPVRTRAEAKELAEHYWGSMMWQNGKAYPFDSNNPCVVEPIKEQP